MTDETKEYIEALREALDKQRGYASYFDWYDSDIKEWGIVTTLNESFEKLSNIQLSNIESRGQGNDPPDCQAKDAEGNHLAIEVTELVDPKMVELHQHEKSYAFAKWDKLKFVAKLNERLEAKNYTKSFKGGPYDIKWLVIHTDEFVLTAKKVIPWLEGESFKRPNPFDNVFLLFSYDPSLEICPYIPLPIQENT